jgi:very-short-patch-repair endonuclease
MRLKSASRPDGGVRRAREGRLTELAGRQHEVVKTAQLVELGFTHQSIARRVEAGRLHPWHEGVFAVGRRDLTRDGVLMAAALACGHDALVSHRSAAVALELFDFPLHVIEVTVPGLGSRRRPGLRIHRTRSLESTERSDVRAIPVTSVARTLLDLSGTIAPRHLRRCYERAERNGILDRAALVACIEAHRGRRGIGALRRLAAYDPTAASRTRSELELLFLDFCREEDLPIPLVNTQVAGYEVDMLWRDASLIVELDSWEFHGDREAFERDRAKASDLKLAGYDVVRVTYRRLTHERSRLRQTLSVLLAHPEADSGSQ